MEVLELTTLQSSLAELVVPGLVQDPDDQHGGERDGGLHHERVTAVHH